MAIMQQTGDICNSPNLKQGMIPVKWNGTSWVKADKENTSNDWYNYNTNSKKWANVVTVKESGTKTREYYLNAAVNTEIKMEDITTMFVWIPRYAYKIKEGYYHTAANGTGEIEIKWLAGTTDITIAGEKIERTYKTNETFTVHPAFTNDTKLGGSGTEITGFWAGKFECSNSDSVEDNTNMTTSTTDTNILYGKGTNANSYITIKPNVTSWRSIDVGSIYTKCQDMTKNSIAYGLSASETITTMMQNSQWGAVAYLAQSAYGNRQDSTKTGSGIWNNSYNEALTYTANNDYGVNSYCVTLTGMSGSTRDSYSSYYAKQLSKTINTDTIQIKSRVTTKKTTEIKNEETNEITSEVTYEDTDYTNTFYRYYTENGQKASTTGTIYGIYDMSGGAWEYMASRIVGTSDSYGFKTKDSRYVTIYEGTEEYGTNNLGRRANYLANKTMYGDAVYETSKADTIDKDGNDAYNGGASWNGDYSYFPYASGPFFRRGGNFSYSSSAGVFYFNYAYGGTYEHSGFRAVAL